MKIIKNNFFKKQFFCTNLLNCKAIVNCLKKYHLDLNFWIFKQKNTPFRLYLVFIFLSTFKSFSQSDVQLEGLLYSNHKPVRIYVKNGKIDKIIEIEKLSVSKPRFIAPGLIDIQINGYQGIDFSDQSLTLDKMHTSISALWKAGVTSFLPTIISSDTRRLQHTFRLLGQMTSDPLLASSVPGFHLEGPYISPLVGFRGVHAQQHLRQPDWEEFQNLHQLSNGKIKLITLAPELTGAIDFIKNASKNKHIVALGHHNASSAQIQDAVSAGAKLSTHLGNGCANEINRHLNPLWPQLANDGLFISIIADGSHLNQDQVKTFVRAKGADKTILVSDALSFAGLPPGTYTSNDGQELLLTQEVVKYPAQNVLAGAASPLSKCIGVVKKYSQCSLQQAIDMATKNPAILMNLNDRGELKEGKRADIILFSFENDQMQIKETYLEGKKVYEN
jgi:N-acetylglucosamine-6-phosphate deacetylase